VWLAKPSDVISTRALATNVSEVAQEPQNGSGTILVKALPSDGRNKRVCTQRKAFAGCSIHPGSALSRQGSTPSTQYTGQERKTTWLFCWSCRTFPMLGFRDCATGEDMKKLIQYLSYPSCQVRLCSYANASSLLFEPAKSSCA